MDPGILSTESLQNQYATQSIIAILRGFLQNCFLAEFEDYRIQEAIKEQIKSLPNSFERKKIKKLFGTLRKRNRFIYCLTPDYSGSKEDLICALEQMVPAFIDLLLLKEINSDLNFPDGVEIATLSTYQNSNFEDKRSKLGNSGGLTIKNGELDGSDFWDQCFKKALRFSTKIEICDRLFGKKFGDNYKYNVRIMFRWLEKNLLDPDNCMLLLHCEKPIGYRGDHIKTELSALKQGRLSNMLIEIQFYQLPGLKSDLPHPRFIITDQIAFQIDPGLDLLDKYTKKNRDVIIKYQSLKEAVSLLKSYENARLPRIAI